MPDRNIDISRGFNIGRQMSPGAGVRARVAAGLAGGVMDRFTQIQQAKQQAALEHALRMKYDPEYRFKYQMYSQLNDAMTPQTGGTQTPPQAPPIGIDRTTGYATGGQFAPGTQVNYAQPQGGMTPPPQPQQQQFLQPTSGMGGMDKQTMMEAFQRRALGLGMPTSEIARQKYAERLGESQAPLNPLQQAQMQKENTQQVSELQQQQGFANPWRARFLGIPVPQRTPTGTDPIVRRGTDSSTGRRVGMTQSGQVVPLDE